MILSSHTIFATGFFECRNVFSKFASRAKILGAFGTPSAWVTFDFRSTVAQVSFFAFVARVSGCVDVLRHFATELTIGYIGVVFNFWTQDGKSLWAVFAKVLALFFVVCTIETAQMGRGAGEYEI